ncbi:MAG: NUDIX hydrolase [Byssovorax sp.]
MSATGEKKEYPRPSLTADVVALLLDEGGLRVLFIRRGNEPFQGSWALPGGFCEPGETVAQAAARELTEETGVSQVRLEELGSFTTPGRDPRGWVVTVAHLGFLPADRAGEAVGSDDAAEAAWLHLTIDRDGAYRLEHAGAPVTTLAFDHREVIALAVRRLRERVAELAFALIPEPFTLAEAQRAFEVILGGPLDHAAFRAEIAREGVLRQATEATPGAPRYHAISPPIERRWPFAGAAR